jgi:predicted nucleotidyltransferase component of viral defense system
MTIIDQMLEQYDLVTLDDKKNAIKEIMQEIVLAGLSKTNFFKNVAFYGGTALRIYHDLNRFSEDLDFTLLASDKNFTFETYIPMINQTVESLGLKFEISTKKKKQNSNVKSAFLKGNTKEQFLIFYPDSNQEAFVQNNEKIKIKFEIDIDPPLHASTDTSYRLLPFPYEVRIYDKPSLFAGKLHAVIARKWKKRVKGRDLYDYVFYLSTNTPVNLKHLEARLKQTKSIDEDVTLTKESLIDILNNRFDDIDFEDAKNDVFPFIKDIENLDMWSTNFFKSITKNLQVA